MQVFHPFPRLPYELRAQIWEMTVEPRTVEVRLEREYGEWGEPCKTASWTPVPSVLQTCRESRAVGLRCYQKAFVLPSASEPRHVWVNFGIDTISIGDTYFDHIKPEEQLLIRRLMFERENTDTFFRVEGHELNEYKNLEEISVVCLDDAWGWWDAWYGVPWPCPMENLRFIDKDTGEVVTNEQMAGMYASIMGR